MQNWRLFLIVFLLLLFGFGLLARLSILQIVDHGFYKALAKGQQSLPTVTIGDRGDIFFTDKQGNLYTVATTKKQAFAFVFRGNVQFRCKEFTPYYNPERGIVACLNDHC